MPRETKPGGKRKVMKLFLTAYIGSAIVKYVYLIGKERQPIKDYEAVMAMVEGGLILTAIWVWL